MVRKPTGIHCCDCVEGMKQLKSGIVDLTVTSPPYHDIREFHGGTWDLISTIKELYRITAKGGVVAWVTGDKIDKEYLLLPERQAIAFQKEGFRIHDKIIYKSRGTNNPSQVRYYNVIEHVYVFSKGKPKTFNPIKDRDNRIYGTKYVRIAHRERNGEINLKKRNIPVKKKGVRFNVWEYLTGGHHTTTDKIAYQHSALMPERLAHDLIISWSQPRDLVFDCFSGAGTTAKMAKLKNRKYLGFEISEEYCEIARRRLKSAVTLKQPKKWI